MIIYVASNGEYEGRYNSYVGEDIKQAIQVLVNESEDMDRIEAWENGRQIWEYWCIGITKKSSIDEILKDIDKNI